MKKIFLALAAVAALAACSKSEAEYEQTKEISLVAVPLNITKAMITGQSMPTTDLFNVWAWYKQLPAGTPISTWQSDGTKDQWYVQEKPFGHRGLNEWGGVTPYYWPKLGSLLFAGYYPVDIKNSVEYFFDETNNRMVFNNIPQSEVNDVDADEYTEDIMYFNMTGVSSSAGPVAVVFRHALSWITVNVKKSEGSPKIVIDEIKFTKVNDKGTGTVNNSTENNEILWVTNGNVDAVTIFGTDVELQEEETKLVEPLFIPQTMAGELVITYTIYSSATEYFTETYTADLNSFKTSEAAAMTKWEPAKHYTYNIEIGTSEIFIKPTVQTWDNVTVPVETLK